MLVAWSGPSVLFAFGSLNGDGAADLVVCFDGAANRIYLNTNPSDFSMPFAGYQTFGGDDSTRACALADVNGDGALDLVVGNSNTNPTPIRLYLNNNDGTGTFAAVTNLPGPNVVVGSSSYAAGGSGGNLVLGDVNGDGAVDVIVSSAPSAEGNGFIWSSQRLGSSTLRLWLNRNNGAACSASPDGCFALPIELPTGDVPTATLALGDVNGDSLLDIVLVNHYIGGGGSLRFYGPCASITCALGIPRSYLMLNSGDSALPFNGVIDLPEAVTDSLGNSVSEGELLEGSTQVAIGGELMLAKKTPPTSERESGAGRTVPETACPAGGVRLLVSM